MCGNGITNKKNRLVICDFDGTLINGELEMFFMKWLLHQNKIRFKLLVIAFFTLPINILRNKFGYSSVLKSWTFVLKEKTPDYIALFLKEKKDNINLKTEVWVLMESLQADKKILLTGCYEDLAKAFLKYKGLDTKFDIIIGSTVKSNFLFVSNHPFGRKKMQYVDKENYNIGIANDKSDKYYMNLCNEKYYI